jgi:hypothetical protein
VRIKKMKKSRICLFIIFILAVSCTKSRFATTTRHYHNGKVAYSKHYSNERMSLNRHKTKHHATLTRAASAKTAGNPMDNPETINKMNPIASADKNFLILNNGEKLVGQYTQSIYPEFHNEKELTQSKHPWEPLTKDLATVSIKKISRGDTTIVIKYENNKENAAGIKKQDNRKTEKLGLLGFIFSFLGIIPFIGIPFGVLAIIFGGISLRKINKNPKKYKGNGLATASIIIGCAMIVINIVIIAASTSAVNNAPAPTYDSSSTDCKV